MSDAINIAVLSGLAIACAWGALRLSGRATSVLLLPILASAALCGIVTAGSLGLFKTTPALGSYQERVRQATEAAGPSPGPEYIPVAGYTVKPGWRREPGAADQARGE